VTGQGRDARAAAPGTTEIPALNRTLRLRAFAKINLGLRILGRRPDGYHEIRTIYQTVSLHDRLEISLSKSLGGTQLQCDDPSVPSGRANLVYRACQMWREARRHRGGIRVRLEKQIPIGSGLGGASTDAAATLLGLERLTGARLTRDERFALAAQLGSDVPLFLWGGRVLGCGRGEEVYPLRDLAARRCLIVFPGFSISTAQAYHQAGSRLTSKGKASNIDNFGAWPLFPQENWGPAENDFERVVFAKWPELARLKAQLLRAGAEIASLTGSGSAIFALFRFAHFPARTSKLIPHGWQVFRTRTLSRSGYQRMLFEP
jgi:4-diphosphocytidyl-2-C-methyl-D-erythritol kinase